jgi:putative aldouronate transport system substrate-binding protein
MKLNLRSLLLMVLCLVMIITAVACGKATDESTESEPAESTVALDPNAEPAQDAFGKYDPPIEVTTIHTNNSSPQGFWFKDGDTIDNNIYTRTYEETLGIKYKFLWTSPSDQAKTKLNLTIASGDLPDVMSVDMENFEKLHQAGLIEDITQPLQDYATKYTKSFMSGELAIMLEPVTKNGRIYGIPNGFSYKDNGDMLWIRADWLRNVGLEAPTTLAELEKVMDAFVNQDPDKNGKKDSYAIALGGANGAGIGNAYYNMFHVYPNLWLKNTKGELEHGMYGAEQRVKMTAALNKLKEYYNNGYLNKDFYTFDDNQVQQQLFTDKAGLVFGGLWDAWWPLVQHLDVNKNAEWIPIPIPTSDDKPAKTGVNAVSVNNVLVVKKGFAHPEAIVKMTNLYHDLNNNPETIQIEKYGIDPADSNQIFNYYPMHVYDPSFNFTGYTQIIQALESGDGSKLSPAYKLFYDQVLDYEKNKTPGSFPSYKSYTKHGSMGVVDTYIKEKRIQMNEYTAAPTTTMVENGATIRTQFEETFLTVVTGQGNATLDSFLETYDSLLGVQATKEVNDWFVAKGKNSIQDWFESE